MVEKTEIWKWTLNTGRNRIEMPAGAEILTVAAQGQDTRRQDICIWAKVNPDTSGKQERVIFAVATGRAFAANEGTQYLGTAFLAGGALIFHVFEDTAV